MEHLRTYSPLFEQAIRTCIRMHDGQVRKTDRSLPYSTHLIHVAGIVLAHGFDVEVAAAALLHDTLEDTDYTPEDLAADFGDRICSIVMTVTENKFLRWEARKQAYLDAVRRGSEEAKAVCCADKIHNLSTIVAEYRLKGDELWHSFSRGQDVTLRFYHQAFDAISTGWSHSIVDEYRIIVEAARKLFEPGYDA